MIAENVVDPFDLSDAREIALWSLFHLEKTDMNAVAPISSFQTGPAIRGQISTVSQQLCFAAQPHQHREVPAHAYGGCKGRP